MSNSLSSINNNREKHKSVKTIRGREDSCKTKSSLAGTSHVPTGTQEIQFPWGLGESHRISLGLTSRICYWGGTHDNFEREKRRKIAIVYNNRQRGKVGGSSRLSGGHKR